MTAAVQRARKTNLRPATSRFIGRGRELSRLGELYAEGHRLVTVFGSAGTGKTRLAEAFAARAQAEFCGPGGGGVWICELAAARDLEGVCAAVGSALKVPPAATTSDDALVRRHGDAIAARGPILIILDNFEHLVESAAQTVGTWMAAAPEVRFLVTSREQLRLRGEVRFELPPMTLPDGSGRIEDADAVQLMVDRVNALDPSFVLTPKNAPTVAALCEKLEGIPLAIELAASRVELFGLSGLIEQLDKRLDVLVHSSRDAEGRHATLRAAIDWSWGLLDDTERALLKKCAVFRGGFDAGAADAVLRPESGRAPVLGVVQSLRDKSLLRRYEPDELPDNPRFSLFEAVREFAQEQLDASGEATAAQASHGAYYLAKSQALAEEVEGPDGPRALRALALEAENLQAVHERALGSIGQNPAAPTDAVRCALALDAVASVRGPLAAHLDLLERTVTATEDSRVDTPLRIRVLRALARARRRHGQEPAAARGFGTALEAAQTLGDAALQAQVLVDIGVMHHDKRETATAQQLYERALEHARAAGDRRIEGRVLGNLGALHHDVRRYDEAVDFYRQALALVQEVGDRRLEAIHVSNLGVLEQETGDLARARAHFEAADEILADLGDRRFQAIVAGNLGTLEHHEGRLEESRACHERALGMLRSVGDRRSEALCLGRLGRTNGALGWLDDARSCLAAAQRLLGRYPDSPVAAAVDIDHGFVEIAEARRARAAGDDAAAEQAVARARQRIEDATRRVDDAPSWADKVDDVRAAVRLLERELDREAEAPGDVSRQRSALVIGPEGRWMQVPAGAPQDLRRRRALRLILLRLAEQHRGSPGAGLSLETLLGTGWPGERVVPTAGANRVYVALTTLRKLGLRGYLLSQDDGYLLDPALPVEHTDSRDPPASGR